MSFVVTAYAREGIVMAADSRLTLNTQSAQGTGIMNLIAIGLSDSNQKLYLTSRGVGISTVGAGDIGGVPIAGFIEQFVEQIVSDNSWSPELVSDEVIKYFSTQPVVPNTFFHVAGYEPDKLDQQVWYVELAAGKKSRMNPPGQYGVAWAGESDTIGRILNPSAEIDTATNQIKNIYPRHEVPFQFFTLQDAIDFAVYAVRTTIDTIRFQSRPKTVGGPIDLLVIKPKQAMWIQRKELSAK